MGALKGLFFKAGQSITFLITMNLRIRSFKLPILEQLLYFD